MSGTRRALLFSFVGVVVPTCYVFSLYVVTEQWRVFSNDYRLFIWGIPAFAGAVGIAIIGLRRPALWSFLVLLVPIFFVSRQQIINQRLRDCVASCANHSSFWGSYDFDGTASLPGSNEFADFLMALHKGEPDPLLGKRCPGYKRVGTKTGVVFVGGGLRLASLRDQEVLVAFCSWKCHPIPYDHQHCLVWEWADVNGAHRGIFRRVCSDTKDMIGRIERALKQADEGVVPYSRAAHLLLADELKCGKPSWTTQEASNKTVQRTGASRFAQRQIERHRRLAPVADLCVRRRNETHTHSDVAGGSNSACIRR